jgi:predicted nucleic acid-binding protein
MIVIDTNVWVSFYNENDYNHPQAFKELKQVFNDYKTIILPEPIISETYTVLLYKCGREKANYFLRFALNNNQLKLLFVNADLFRSTCDIININNKKLSFIDLTLVIISRKFQCKLLSYDKDLLKFIQNPNLNC